MNRLWKKEKRIELVMAYQSGRKTTNNFKTAIIHRLWLIVRVERVAPRVRSTAILGYVQEDKTMITTTAYQFGVVFVIALYFFFRLNEWGIVC